jgi:hypothetical protein
LSTKRAPGACQPPQHAERDLDLLGRRAVAALVLDGHEGDAGAVEAVGALEPQRVLGPGCSRAS